MKDGKTIENQTFDVEQVVMVTPKAPKKMAPHGGPRIEPTREKDSK